MLYRDNRFIGLGERVLKTAFDEGPHREGDKDLGAFIGCCESGRANTWHNGDGRKSSLQEKAVAIVRATSSTLNAL
jgi:hypothetical protein